MKIVTILGARPQFIKAGTVSREVRARNAAGENIQEVIVHTGQHYDANMSDIFFAQMQIPKPDHFLGISGIGHGAMTGQMIEKIEAVLLQERPDLVLVYGDTNSTLAGALAAVKLDIGLAHVEAGLRSFNLQMPEEVNRILTDRISQLLFCPTRAAVDNLHNEGCDKWQTGARVFLTGDVMYDGVLFYRQYARRPQIPDLAQDFILCTLHRQENTDDPRRLGQIIEALTEIARERQVILPLHPRTRQKLEQGDFDTTTLILIEPQGYLNMVWLLDHCSLVMTDSGGLQKEAFFFARPCITLRDETEWIELVEGGFNRLAGADRARILDLYRESDFATDYEVDLYGDGHASREIVTELLRGG